MKKILIFLTLLIGGNIYAQTPYEYDTLTNAAVKHNPLSSGKFVLVRGRTSANDGGGGLFMVTNSIVNTNTITKYKMSTNGWSLQRIYDGPLNAAWAGATPNSTTDNASALQAIMDFAATQGGGDVLLQPNGTNYYRVRSTVTLREGVRLHGFRDHNNSNNGGTNTVIYHDPSVVGTPLFVLETPKDGSYVRGFKLDNLTLRTSDTTATALNFTNAGYMVLGDMDVKGFDTVLKINFAISSQIERCLFRNSTTQNVLFQGSVSTTTTFRDCYFSAAPWAVVMNADSTLNPVFFNCVFESCAAGIDIMKGNYATFFNCYSEDIPSSNAANPIFQVGVNGTSAAGTNNVSAVYIYGGHWAGYNTAGPATGSSFINADDVYNIYVSGADVRRCDKIIKTTTNTKRVEINGLTHIQSGSDPWGSINNWEYVLGTVPVNRSGGVDISVMRSDRFRLPSQTNPGTQSEFFELKPFQAGGVQGSFSGTNRFYFDTNGNFTNTANINVGGTLGVTGVATLSSNLTVSGFSTLAQKLSLTPGATQTIGTSTALVVTNTFVRIVATGAGVTRSNATEFIADGTDGQILILMGTDDTNSPTIQDEGSSNILLQNGEANREYDKGDVSIFIFDSVSGLWQEVSWLNK